MLKIMFKAGLGTVGQIQKHRQSSVFTNVIFSSLRLIYVYGQPYGNTKTSYPKKRVKKKGKEIEEKEGRR